MAELAWHLLNIAWGVCAGVICFAVFFACGLAVSPADRGRGAAQAAAFDASPAIVGAAIYVLLCWFGVRQRITVTTTITAFSALTLLLVGVRCRAVAAAMRARHLVSRATLGRVLAFAVLYTLAYAFFSPWASRQFLPLASYGNRDIFFYLTFTRYLQDLGSSNVFDYSFLQYVYLQTPAVFYVLGFFSVCFGREPILAAMPMLFACSGLIGLVTAGMSHAVFRLPRLWAVLIGCTLVSGPLFRYVVGNGYMSTLMALPVLLHLLWITASRHPGQRVLDPSLALSVGAHYVLLLFMYPAFLPAGVVFQFVIVGLLAIASLQPKAQGTTGWRVQVRHAGATAAAVAVALVSLVVLARRHLVWSMAMARDLAKVGIAGWPLDLISPLAIFGWPGRIDFIAIAGPGHRLWAVAAFCAIAAGLASMYFWRYRRSTTVAQRSFVGFGSGTLLAYCGYFLIVGPSYQQWKFASYFVLPLTVVLVAGGLRLLLLLPSVERLMASRHGPRVATWIVGAAAAWFVGGNVFVHALAEPPLQRWEIGLRNLALIDGLTSFRELDVEGPEGGATALTVYFVRTKTLHLVSPSNFPLESVDLERISRHRPYLIQNFGCEGVGHGDSMTIEGVGCLLFSPPSLAFDEEYPFSRTFRPITLEGMSRREPWGRWNQRRTVLLSFLADAQRMPLDRDAFLNLRLAPHVPPALAARELSMAWGNGRQAGTTLAVGEWLSLPLQPGDWAGGPKLFTLDVSVSMPDAVPLRDIDPRSTDTRPIAVGFQAVSFSATPRGRVLEPAAANR